MRREELLADFKTRMRAGEVMAGMQHNSGSEAVIEMLGYTGFDFVIIDMEHSGYSLHQVENLVRAAEAAGVVAFIRILKNDKHVIMQALETGAQGLLIPHIMSKQDCLDALAAMRYQPVGIRGKTGGSRAARWGSGDWAAYQEWANTEPLCIPIIEDKEAVEITEEILSVDGLELISVGPGDLSQSYNEPNAGLRSDKVMAALDRAIAYCEPRNIGVMTIPIPDLDNEFVKEITDKGARVVWYAVDLFHVGKHFRNLAKIKTQ
jgi:2-keto-3-deoxy-L-rhamnonate aldolase RhmA